jgi:phosphohistidine swiveling domain-containing protein
MSKTKTRKGKKVAYVFTETVTMSPAVLGGKGAGLVEMAHIGVPVPPGFTDTTAVARAFAQHGVLPKRVHGQNQRSLAAVEKTTGKRFGDPANPLLLSVRSGAAVSMPGMMDTILNLGLNPDTVKGMGMLFGERFALDCYRRFLTMYGDVVLGVERRCFEAELERIKREWGVSLDSDMPIAALQSAVACFRCLIEASTGEPMVDDPHVQLEMAMLAVLRSWNSERARDYRRVNGISNDLGTAINVQAMVFGNRDNHSATGVVFSRNCVTGEAGLWGEFLVNAQGEDVVAGVRQAQPVSQMAAWNAVAYAELNRIVELLALRRNEVVDVEFTVESGVLYILQVRKAKLTAEAAVTVAVHGHWAKALSKPEALAAVTSSEVEQVKAEGFRPEALAAAVRNRLLCRGLPASPGAVSGRVVQTSAEAVAAAARGEQVVLVRPDTSPDDLKGMLAAVAIVTATGGATSHAAIVARGLGKPCVVGCTANGGRFDFFPGEVVSVDGKSGVVIRGEVERMVAAKKKEVNLFLRWLEEARGESKPAPRLACEMVEQSVSIYRLINDFYLTDGMARAAVGSCLEREARLLRTRVQTDVAERVAMYLSVAVGGEIRWCEVSNSYNIVAEIAALESEFRISWGGRRGAAQLRTIAQLKVMALPDQLRFAGLAAATFRRGRFPGGCGGQPWAVIAEALEGFLSGALNHSVFADHAFDLEHNDGTVFGKHAMVETYCRDDVKAMLDIKRHARTLTELKTRLGCYSSDMSEAVSDLFKRGERLKVWQRSEGKV